MRLRGRFYRSGRFWLAEIPLLDAMTQGRTRQELFDRVVDLVETLADRPGFSAQGHPGRNGEFERFTTDLVLAESQTGYAAQPQVRSGRSARPE